MPTEISLSRLQDAVYQALKSWHNPTDDNPLTDLLLYHQIRRAHPGAPHHIINRLILETLAALPPAEADLLRWRFLDGLTMYAAANRLNLGEAAAYRRQQEGLKLLSQTLFNREKQTRRDYQINLEKRLTLPPATDLVGVAAPLEAVLTALIAPGPPWLVSVEGLGGLGKTALVNALTRQYTLAGRFDNLAWVSAKQRELLPGADSTAVPVLTAETLIDALLAQLAPAISLAQPPAPKQAALTQLLKDNACLLVIDNLETMADYETLLPLLRRLANPSKFLLTSRHSLRACPDVFCLPLAELSQADTLRLLRDEAARRGLADVAAAPADQLVAIYDVVGGNPLALQLVIGLLSQMSLTHVLDNLKQARGHSADALYTYIYWQSWRLLTPAGQQLFLTMPLAQGGDRDQLQVLSHLTPAEFDQAMAQLITLSLVLVSGGLAERRYSLHRLTETFLLQEAVQWQAPT